MELFRSYRSSKLSNDCLFGTGFRSVLFEHKNENGEIDEYVLAFAGTTITDAEDWANNIAQLIGASPQYQETISVAREVHATVNGLELTYVGHSLGGGEATAASMATGAAAMTFNSAAVTDFTLSANDINNLSLAKIDNYVATGTYIPFLGIRLGGDIVNNLQQNLNLHLRGTIHEIYTGLKPTHSISAMIDAIKKQFHH